MRSRRRATATLLAATAVSLVSAACSDPGGGDATSAADTLTRRQKDSLVSTMPIPGAGAVGGAMDARDAANARAAAHDSIR